MHTLSLALAILVGCQSPWARLEGELDERTEAMGRHEQEAFSVLRALDDGDLAALRRHGAALAPSDAEVPGLPQSVRRLLDQVRASSRALGAAQGLEEAAELVVGLTADCAACHQALEVPTPAAWGSESTRDRAWLSLAFEDETLWEASAAGLAGEDWAARRAALLAALTSPTPGDPPK